MEQDCCHWFFFFFFSLILMHKKKAELRVWLPTLLAYEPHHKEKHGFLTIM